MTVKYGHSAGKPAGISEKLVRLLEIYTAIARKKYPSVADLADRFGVTKRTVFRYLELINMIDPVELDKERNGYVFIHGDRSKKERLADEELMTLFTAGEALSHLGEPFRESFRSLVNRVFVTSGKSTEANSIPIIIKTHDAAANESVDGYLKTISACLKEKRCVALNYRSRSAKELTERIVDPYGLVFYDGIWILIGYCHLRKDIRSFALDRIIDLTERWLYFEPKEDFSLEEYLANGWGVIQGETRTRVTVRFNAAIADYILRKKRWHRSEKRKILKGGRVELTFTVAGVNEIKRWIFSWLPDVEVVEPAWLRNQFRKELLKSADQHK